MNELADAAAAATADDDDDDDDDDESETWLTGAQSDARPPSPRAGGRRQEHQGVVHQGAQDQSDLPHAQHVQPRRDAEMSHQRVLVSGQRPGEDPDGSAPRNGQWWDAVVTAAIYDFGSTPVRLLIEGHQGHSDVTHQPQSRWPIYLFRPQ